MINYRLKLMFCSFSLRKQRDKMIFAHAVWLFTLIVSRLKVQIEISTATGWIRIKFGTKINFAKNINHDFLSSDTSRTVNIGQK